MVLNIVSLTILDAPYTWLTFLGALGIRVLNGLNGTSKTFRYTPLPTSSALWCFE